MRKKNLNGCVFGKLTVLKEVAKKPNNKSLMWLCRCECGKETVVSSGHLMSGHTTSCGCVWYGHKDLTGMIFGRLTVIKEIPHEKGKALSYLCECECGKEKVIQAGNLNRGTTRSCGCLRYELLRSKRGADIASWKGAQPILKDGYPMLYLPDYPMYKKKSRIPEHVYIMSEHIGRPLEDGENVHHKNGIRTDNRLENLELWTTIHPRGTRICDLIEYALWVLSKYRPELLSSIAK